jgi:hypothetical protein
MRRVPAIPTKSTTRRQPKRCPVKSISPLPTTVSSLVAWPLTLTFRNRQLVAVSLHSRALPSAVGRDRVGNALTAARRPCNSRALDGDQLPQNRRSLPEGPMHSSLRVTPKARCRSKGRHRDQGDGLRRGKLGSASISPGPPLKRYMGRRSSRPIDVLAPLN